MFSAIGLYTLVYFLDVRSPHPTTSPFPYTTLFRSGHAHRRSAGQGRGRAGDLEFRDAGCGDPGARAGDRLDHGQHGAVIREFERSEEHTSELQSLRQLVCRLLLEKTNRNFISDFLT